MLATIPRDEVHSLWKLLKRGFCPQSSMEISERGRRFFDMHQEDESVTNFTTSVLEEKDILGFLNEPKSDADVKAVIIGGLATDDAKAFPFRLVHHSLTDFISEVNSYDMLLSFQRKSRSSSAMGARSSNQVSNSIDPALVTSSTPYASPHVQCFHCDGFGHIARDCPDSLIPKEELHRRKHPRTDDPSFPHNSDRGRGRGGNTRGGRHFNYRSRGRYRGKGRGRPRGNNSHYRPHTNASSEPDGHAALVIIDDGVESSSTHLMTDFDWLSLGSFQPMENTMALGPQLEEEPMVSTPQDDMSQEEHYILSAIDDGDDVDYGEQEVISLETLVATTDVPPLVFANVIILEQPMEVQVTPNVAPILNLLQEVPAEEPEVYSIRDSNSTVSSLDDADWIDMNDEVGPPPLVEPDIAVVHPQDVDLVDVIRLEPQEVEIVAEALQDPHDVDVIEVVPQAPDSPISIRSDDDESLSDFRVHSVVTHWLHLDHGQPRNFLTRPESRNIRQYIRYLRSQIQAMRLRLRVRIDQIKRLFEFVG